MKGGKYNKNILSAVLTASIAFLIVFSNVASSFEINIGTDQSTYSLGRNVTFSINATISSGEIIPMNKTYLNITGASNSLTNCELTFNESGYTDEIVTCNGQTLAVNLTTASNFTSSYGYLYVNLTNGTTSPSGNPYSWGYGFGYGALNGTGVTSFNYTIIWKLPSSWSDGTYTAKIVFNTSGNKIYYNTVQFTAESVASPGPAPSYGMGVAAAEESEEECVPSWSCSGWSDCINGRQTRSCSDAHSCGTLENKPVETRDCEVPVTPVPEVAEVPPTLPSTQVPLGVWTFAALPVAIFAGLIYFMRRRKKRGRRSIFVNIKKRRRKRR